MQASNYLSKIQLPGASQCSKSGQNTHVHVQKVLNSSQQTQGRSATVNSSDKRRARHPMEVPQSSERVSRQMANRGTRIDHKAEGPCLILSFPCSLLVTVWRGRRSQLAAQPALCFYLATRLESTSCRTFLFNKPKIFCIESVFSFISFLYRLRICILSVFKKLRQKSYLIEKMLVMSISEWSQIWQIHKPLLLSHPADEGLHRLAGRRPRLLNARLQCRVLADTHGPGRHRQDRFHLLHGHV